MMKFPYLVVSDRDGNIFEIPELYMAGMSLNAPALPTEQELIPLPYGSDLYLLPERTAVGYDPRRKKFVEVKEYHGEPVFAAAAFMAPAYLQVYRSAFATPPGAPRLSLFSYTAVGWKNGQFYAAGKRIDPDMRQDLSTFNLNLVEQEARRILRRYPQNRLTDHLIRNCVFRYGCPAARNFALGRWECPIPTSPGCNAACVGCISEQPAETGVRSTQDRLNFMPSGEEIVEFAVPHLENAPRAVVSFGQGCEGEPLLAGPVIKEAIKEIRRRTDRGIINLNTNASRPAVVEELCKAGLDSIRVSLNSAQKGYYEAYYRPRHYGFEDLVESLRVMRRYNRWASINYFVFPGFTDHPEEVSALESLIGEVKINMIQARNLNIDPEWYIEELGLGELAAAGGNSAAKPLGIPGWIERISQKFPWIKWGYFNPPREEMKGEHYDWEGIRKPVPADI